MARQRFERATVLLLPGLVMWPDLHLLLLTETAKREEPSRPELLVLLVQANLETQVPILRVPREKPLVQASQLVLQEKNSEFASQPANRRQVFLLAVLASSVAKANRRLVLLLLAAQVRRRDLFLHLAKLQGRRHRLEQGWPVPQARARQCSRCPGPCAFCQETPTARKCNRAARCDGYPIFARCRPPRNRRALAGCDNKCSRSRRKRARRARTFPIGAADKCRCLPRPIAD